MGNINTIQHMFEHCEMIGYYLKKANIITYDDFRMDTMVQDAVVMRLCAMGELTTHLTDDFKNENSAQVDWRNLKQLRNIIAHRYGSIQFDTIWGIIQKDVPIIRNFCLNYLEQNNDCSTDYEMDEEEFEP